MSFWFEDVETRYDITKNEAFAVVQGLAEVRWLVIRSDYSTKLYTDYSALESIFTQRSDTYRKSSHRVSKLRDYNYKVHHRLCKANIIRIENSFS